MAMLEGEQPLTLELPYETTQAWVEQEYHRTVHTELKELKVTPLARYLAGHRWRTGAPTRARCAMRSASKCSAAPTARSARAAVASRSPPDYANRFAALPDSMRCQDRDGAEIQSASLQASGSAVLSLTKILRHLEYTRTNKPYSLLKLLGAHVKQHRPTGEILLAPGIDDWQGEERLSRFGTHVWSCRVLVAEHQLSATARPPTTTRSSVGAAARMAPRPSALTR
jgi:hypothetical protein